MMSRSQRAASTLLMDIAPVLLMYDYTYIVEAALCERDILTPSVLLMDIFVDGYFC